MKPTVADVQGLWSDLKSATSSALAFLTAKPVDTKRIPLFQSMPCVFPIVDGLPQAREVTWVNPAGDAHFTEVGHETWLEAVEGANSRVIPLVDSEIGIMFPALFDAGDANFPALFDFEWNFKYGRDGAQYGIESAIGGTDGYLSRKSLGNKARAQMLGWSPDEPLTILAGDSITWTILPTLFQINRTATAFSGIRSITVNLFMSGFRTGTPAEADYELR
jgi:hypothetical protein